MQKLVKAGKTQKNNPMSIFGLIDMELSHIHLGG
jgi:hypothetical protein